MISLDTYYSSSQYKGTSGTNIGREGYVPQAQISESGNYLRGDGKWVDFGLANLTSTYTTVRSLSDSWEESASITPLQAASASWNSVYTTTNTNSAKWESNYTSFNTNSAKYDSVYTTTNTNSGKWESVYTTVQGNSGNYILDGGNTKGANLSIGSNDSFNLNIETNNANRISILSSGETKFLTKYSLLSTTVPSAEFSSGIIVGTDVATLSSYNIPTGYNIGQFSTNGLLIGQNDVGAYVGNVSISENSFSVIPSSIGTNNSLKLGVIVGNFDCIAASSDGRYVTITTDTVGVYAGRTGGVIYVSNDFGNTFTARITDDPTRRFFNAAMSVDGRIQYVTAITVNNSGLWASYDYGVTWTRQLTLDLRGLATSSDGRIVVAGLTIGAGIYISRDYGANWTLINSTIGATKIAISSDGRIITVVNTNGNITTSFDYGNSWETRSIITAWTDVAMSADGKNQIASSQTSSNGGVFVSNNYGVSWTRRLGPSALPYTGVCMSSCGKYMFTTLYRQSSPFVIPGSVSMSTNYGATFATLSMGDNDWQRIKCSSDGRILYTTTFQFGVNGTNFYSSYGQIYNQSSITVNNTISSSSIIFASGGNSDSWNSAYTTTNSNSARWQSNYTSFNTNSAKYDSVYTTTNSNSGKWESSYLNQNALSGRWDSSYNNQNTLSGRWDSSYLNQNALSGRWDSSYNNQNTLSGRWESTYTTVQQNSATSSFIFETDGTNILEWPLYLQLFPISPPTWFFRNLFTSQVETVKFSGNWYRNAIRIGTAGSNNYIFGLFNVIPQSNLASYGKLTTFLKFPELDGLEGSIFISSLSALSSIEFPRLKYSGSINITRTPSLSVIEFPELEYINLESNFIGGYGLLIGGTPSTFSDGIGPALSAVRFPKLKAIRGGPNSTGSGGIHIGGYNSIGNMLTEISFPSLEVCDGFINIGVSTASKPGFFTYDKITNLSFPALSSASGISLGYLNLLQDVSFPQLRYLGVIGGTTSFSFTSLNLINMSSLRELNFPELVVFGGYQLFSFSNTLSSLSAIKMPKLRIFKQGVFQSTPSINISPISLSALDLGTNTLQFCDIINFTCNQALTQQSMDDVLLALSRLDGTNNTNYYGGNTVFGSAYVLTLAGNNRPPSYTGGVTTTSAGTNFSRVGTLVTANVTGHGHTNGDIVTFTGNTQSALNGTYIVTVITANQFQYTTTTSGNITGGGTVTMRRTTVATDGFRYFQTIALRGVAVTINLP